MPEPEQLEATFDAEREIDEHRVRAEALFRSLHSQGRAWHRLENG
jgi:hypothetical protein